MSFTQDIKEEIFDSLEHKKCCSSVMKVAELLSESKDVQVGKTKTLIKNNKCCRKSFIKGIFLGSGCIVDPKTDYHFEITTKNKKNATYILDILNEVIGFDSKMLKRASNQYVVYIKDSDEISLILSYLGAGKALLQFENLRIERSIKNDINRSINCETANLSKTISAAYKQLMAIDKLEKLNIIKDMPRELKELCMLRKRYPEDSLEALSQKCSHKISKSGINHRLNKIMKIANEN